MEITANGQTYRWHENWARIPDTASGRHNGRTHGVQVLPDGRVAVFAQAVPAVLIYDAAGQLVESWGDRFIGAHGMTLVVENGQPFFWLVDEFSCEVCKTTLSGELVQRLDAPPLADRPNGQYVPTWAAVNPANGDVWVADGYSGGGVRHGWIYRYDASGAYLGVIKGDEGGGHDAQQFLCAHAVAFGPDGDLYVCDRSNQRILALDGEGQIKRESRTACHSATSLAFHDGLIYVGELFGAVKLITPDFELVGELGVHAEMAPPPGTTDLRAHAEYIWNGGWRDKNGWPDVAGTGFAGPGTFSSPHGIAVAPSGDIYVSEWVLGGRVIKLEKLG